MTFDNVIEELFKQTEVVDVIAKDYRYRISGESKYRDKIAIRSGCGAYGIKDTSPHIDGHWFMIYGEIRAINDDQIHSIMEVYESEDPYTAYKVDLHAQIVIASHIIHIDIGTYSISDNIVLLSKRVAWGEDKGLMLSLTRESGS